MKVFLRSKNARAAGRKRRARDLRRGMAIGYVVALMLVVTAFCSLLLAVSSLSTRYADTYNSYLEQKLVLDAIGELACGDYLRGEQPDYTAYTEQGYTVADDSNGTVTVSRGQAVMLTVEFENANGAWQLIRYVYGE